jgi:hypothetical protein
MSDRFRRGTAIACEADSILHLFGPRVANTIIPINERHMDERKQRTCHVAGALA